MRHHPETKIATGNPRLHNRKYTMTCNSTAYVLVGPDVNHLLPYYPRTQPALAVCTLLSSRRVCCCIFYMKDFRIAHHFELDWNII